MRVVVAGLLAFLPAMPICAKAQGAQASSDLMRGAQVHLLEDQGMLPLGNTADAALGDTIDAASKQVVARGKVCFKGLEAERLDHPNFAEHSGSGLNVSAALGLAGVADASLGAGAIRRYDLTFTDVQTAYVTLIDLRHARTDEEPECRRLAPYLTGDYVASRGELLPMIVGKVVYARRRIRIEYDSTASASVQTRSLLARLGGMFTLRATVEMSRQNVVELGADQVLPIAFEPALIAVQRTVGATMGAGPQSSQAETRLEAFDPSLPSHTAAWIEWLSAFE